MPGLDTDRGPSAERRESDRLERVLEIGRSLVSNLELETLLARILEVARELTGARFAALGVLDSERRELDRFITSGIDQPGREAIGSLPRGRGILGLLIERPEPLRLDRIGAHPASFGFPAGHPPMESFLGVPIMIGGEAWGNLYLTEKAGGPFDFDDERSVMALAGWAAIAIENARLHEAAERDREELGHAVRGLEATVAIARAIGGETKLDRVLELIVERGRTLIGARATVVLLMQDEELMVAARAGSVSAERLGRRVPLAGSVFERVLRAGSSAYAEDPFDAAGPGLADLRTASALVVPLRYRGRSIGIMVAFTATEPAGGFRAEQAELLESVAVSAAIAVWTAQNVEDDRARRSLRAAEAERTRWARELHDGTLQGLGALQISLATARRTPDPTLRERVLTQAAEQATEEIAQLRALITDLRPVALDELGIAAALEALVDRVRRTSGLEIRISTAFTAGGTVQRHVPELEIAIYRLVQEALSNAVKHAGAGRIDVAVRERDDWVRLLIDDDGTGFDVRSPSGTGFGLQGMRERVELEHGTVQITSTPGRGTRIEVALPVRRRAPEAPQG